ncbi:ATP-dependent RNA helicase DDX5/DBP2 [Klebsormidium nitens]|uniref:ATP-dependent RNA helicase DDX5/DBP2 n=1 Tax=Klebsormidium nitens TaxID=105231 RepID=A0A1Y1HSI0_KLENI|nr:ATP-dependent RNA helicase DDX5/DBP2 [Klebsormidium nitens]|eukprot:GAQ81073.1 ATP-dependent RNA helicase DDX5/DBP2 [Klebsormidium nitens]
MGRGEEYVKRKHKRAERKRNRADSDGGVSELAAAKKRRRKGKRRITEGMCYSLPTVENPFLDEKERAFRMTHGKKVNPEAPKAKCAKSAPEDPDVTKKKLDSKPAKLRKVFWPKGDAGKGPITSSSDTRLPEVFRSAAESLGVTEPSAFQADIWQAALRGQGVWGHSRGAGEEVEETVAGYVLPAVQHLKAQETGKVGQGPAILILVPSRARGSQVLKACRKIREGGIPLKAVNVHDEANPQDQLEGLESQVVDLVAATPGRLSQLNIIKGDLLSRVTFAVLDSADQMSERDLRQAGLLTESLRADAQTLFFTGSYNVAVHESQRKWLKDPIQRVAASNTPVALCAGIEQRFVYCSEDKKAQRVVKTVLDVREAEQEARAKSRILVLAATPASVNATVEALAESGLRAGARHEDLRTEERLAAEDDFRAGKVPILVTTGITSPGVHASSVPVLIVHDLPGTVEDYVRLVGYVARTTVKGQVHSLLTKEHAHLAVGLSELLQACAQPADSKLEMMARAVKLVQQQQTGTGNGNGKGSGHGQVSGAKMNGAPNGNGVRNGEEAALPRTTASRRDPSRGAGVGTGMAVDAVGRTEAGNGRVAQNGRSASGNGRSDHGSGHGEGDGSASEASEEEEEDDEATLDEEERLAAEEGAPAGDDELRMLEEESSMSVEELLARIRARAEEGGQ